MSERKGVCGVCVYTCACVFMHTYLLFICEVKLVLSIFCNFHYFGFETEPLIGPGIH